MHGQIVRGQRVAINAREEIGYGGSSERLSIYDYIYTKKLNRRIVLGDVFYKNKQKDINNY